MALDLGHKAGPFSVGEWALIGVGGVGLALIFRKRFGGHPAASVTAAPAPAADTPATSGVVPIYTAPTPLVTGPTAPTTNAEWERQAIDYLVANNQDPGQSQAALAQFLEGNEVTPQQAALVNLAIRALGAPPENAPALRVGQVPTTATPTPNTPAPVPANRSVLATGSTRERAKLNALRDWMRFVGQGTADWPAVAASGPLDAPDVKAATVALVTRLNERRANTGQAQLPVDGIYTQDVANEATALAATFHLAY